jgi:hypothetical protein
VKLNDLAADVQPQPDTAPVADAVGLVEALETGR